MKLVLGDIMKKIEIADLYDKDYSVKVINTLTQYWKKVESFSCISSPKRNNMLLYLDNCDATYTLKNGEKIYANCGSVIYTPLHSEYFVKLSNAGNEPCKTVHVNFLLYDPDSSPFVLNDKVEVYSADNTNYRAIFNKIDNYGKANIQCHGKIKSIMYDLLFKLSEYYYKSHIYSYSIIEQGIEYLEKNEEQTLTVSQIADMCNVSEVYFRKLFKKYSGMSPAEYRTAAKIFKAKTYLTREGLSVSDISDRLGYSEVSYFIKVFKNNVGMTPAKYRAAHQAKFNDTFL